jgi:hypothetical protein
MTHEQWIKEQAEKAGYEKYPVMTYNGQEDFYGACRNIFIEGYSAALSVQMEEKRRIAEEAINWAQERVNASWTLNELKDFEKSKITYLKQFQSPEKKNI